MFEESDLTEPKIREPVVKSTDMDEQMQQEAIQVANDALNKFKVEKVSFFTPFFYDYFNTYYNECQVICFQHMLRLKLLLEISSSTSS